MIEVLDPPPARRPPARLPEPAPRRPMTETEYLAYERGLSCGPRHEFVDGDLIEMPGSSRPHNRIALRVVRKLADMADAVGLEAYTHDMRLRVPSGRFRYPDVMIAPEPPEMLPGPEQDTLLNPVVIVEILSRSTATTDRVRKLAEYREIPSLTDYLILSQDGPACTHHRRVGPAAWDSDEVAGPGAAVTLAGLGELALGPLYPPAG